MSEITFSKEAQEQLDKPVSWFKANVKCCANCPSWVVDRTLIGDYAYNFCYAHDADRAYSWDNYCPKYSGHAPLENLMVLEVSE